MKKIKCTLATIDKAIAELSNYQKYLKSKVRETASETADKCMVSATEKFANAVYDGTNDVSVYVQSGNSDTYYVTANGSAVAFIEFGTGVTYSSTAHPIPQESVGLSGIGQYGKGYGKHIKWAYPAENGAGTNGRPLASKPDYILTAGNPANRCLYDAKSETAESIADIAREVFGND